MPCPPGATIRRRFCSSACRQAAYRARRRCRHKIDVVEAVRTLDAELHAAIRELLRAVHESLERLPDRTCPRSTTTGGLLELAQRVIDMAVARDRAAGVPWSEIGEGLGIRTTTARRRYGPRAAERLVRFRATEANTRLPRQ